MCRCIFRHTTLLTWITRNETGLVQIRISNPGGTEVFSKCIPAVKILTFSRSKSGIFDLNLKKFYSFRSGTNYGVILLDYEPVEKSTITLPESCQGEWLGTGGGFQNNFFIYSNYCRPYRDKKSQILVVFPGRKSAPVWFC